MSLATDLKAITDSVRQQIPPEAFATIEAATAKLAESNLLSQSLQVGQTMPDFELPDATGSLIRSQDLRAQGLLLLSFYRGHWCPYCNLQLQALQAHLEDFATQGATLVAISPQLPDQSLTTQEKHSLKFPVLSDVGNLVARQFGLVHTLDQTLQPLFQSFGVDLEHHNGDTSFELPLAASYLVNQDGTVLESFVNVDYRERLTPETALTWLQRAKR